MRRLLVLLLLVLVGIAAGPVPTAQALAKQSRIPRFITDAGAYTGNFRESTNFVVRWGDAVDVVEWARVNRGIDDYPAYVLDKMERTYAYYRDTADFIDPDSISPARDYRINVYLCGSWSGGFLPPANWAGTDDIGVGHICLPYDKYWDDWVESHEYTHVLQSYASQLNRQNGFDGGFGYGNPNSGRFWEAHGNFMARMRRPEVVLGSGYFGSRHHYRWLAQETYYGDWLLLNKLRDTYGLASIHRLWYEARHGEHPIQTIKRLYGLDHAGFAALIGDYARRNVVYDYTDGAAIRSDLWRNGAPYRPLYTVSLETVNQAAGEYRIPAAVAPQQYGFNLIRLQPTQPGGQVTVRLRGQVNPSLGSDWRFGLVGVTNNFSARYSPMAGRDQQVTFSLQSGESYLLLAVAATPSVHVNYGDGAQVDRFPYELTIQGATPVAGTT
ncbi:DUF6055 domain-containing protein [Actinophytocola xanthii]|uniref:Uncharacterized protein n=1 Tax=Actinophytocola xanthii TaxID=1912961 RepID=A0A1Q8CUV6_9PSEU|nr:DUF6055 domain-containing protein [Actinophytocola xanthii]OLF18151.1 hypothetical protein BU204_08480 [Actinophytocola xanthii]